MIRVAGAHKVWLLSLYGGAPPAAGIDAHFDLGAPRSAPDFIAEMAQMEALWADPGPGAMAWLDRLDPARGALGWVAPVAVLDRLADRTRLGRRRAAAIALEDKLVVDALWDDAGVPRPPSITVALADPEALDAASLALDQGEGVVWSGDNRAGLQGGSMAVRWVHDAHSRALALAHLRARCDRVRVAPYLAGTVCSIHAFCLPRGVASFAPVRQHIHTDPATGRFTYRGCSTGDPGLDPHSAELQAVAHRVGQHLSARIGFRGGLSVDGIWTQAGFQPTELNPRFSAGLSTIHRACPELQLRVLDAVVRDRGPCTISPQALQAAVRTAMAAHPQAGPTSRHGE